MKELGADERIILELISKKYGGECEMDRHNSRQTQVAGSCEHSNELSGAIIGGEFDHLSDSRNGLSVPS
jgi:hypothetical protein